MLKPKKNNLYVPTIGVVSKDDFNEDHLAILKLYAEDNELDFEKQIKPQLEAVKQKKRPRPRNRSKSVLND